MTDSAKGVIRAPASASTDGIAIRRVQSADEYDACVRMQHAIWGDDFTEIVPATMLCVTQHIGGVTAGAFDASGQLLGFVFGMIGILDGRPVHWSDLLAVHPVARNKGLGRRLKLYQRELLLPLGVETMFWTYDPLVAKNAYLNIVKLGARPVEYVVDMYGSETHSALHGALGTDRFVVAWDLTHDGGANDRRASALEDGREGAEAPVVNSLTRSEPSAPTTADLPDAPVVRVEVPTDIEELIANDFASAMRLRESTRRIFAHYMDCGYRITAFSHLLPEDRSFYILSRNDS